MIFSLLLAAGIVPGEVQGGPPAGTIDATLPLPRHLLTSTVQFQALGANDYLDECVFHLQGVVTLTDTNRNLLVLQDATGALAVHYDLQGSDLQAGQLVSLDGTNCYPYVVSFPDYPYRPSGQEIRKSFEAPTDWGDYYLTRMRGCLHPPATGEYTFWIASDNSSELWLSQNAMPSKARRIAFIPQYGYVNPHEWSRLPSQRSEPVYLKAGGAYYIEALQEQSTEGNNLAVAWQGPGLNRAVIDGNHLSPWTVDASPIRFAETNGVLREYWTNYSSGDLRVLANSRPFESAVTVEKMRVSVLGKGKLPKPGLIGLREPLPADDNFRWVRAEGVVTFAGINAEGAYLELADGETRIEVRVRDGAHEFTRNLVNSRVRVEGVCEGAHDQNGALVPALIWASTGKCTSLTGPGSTNLNTMPVAPTLRSAPPNANSVMEGFYVTHGVVTFNDRVLGNDCLFVQGDTAAISVSLKERHFKNNLVVGQYVDLGGSLRPGKNIPVMRPLIVTESGQRPLPEPIAQPLQFPVPGTRDGRWTEIEGVVRAVNSNGTLSAWVKDGPVDLWIGKVGSNELSNYEDARLRVRGVLSLTTQDSPLLLVPSRNFVEVEDVPPHDLFAAPLSSVSGLLPDSADYSSVHRVRIRGEVTYASGGVIFIQDASGGIRVQTRDITPVQVGETVEVAGFPTTSGSARLLTGARLHVTGDDHHIQPKSLDLAETTSPKQGSTLVQATGILLSQKTTGTGQLLELEDHQRIFTALLPDWQSDVPSIAAGSRVKVTGIFEDGSIDPPVAGKTGVEGAAGTLNILLRNPADVVRLSGPPWWTLKRTVALVGTLFTVMAVSLLWVYLLRRRLDRQQQARLVFSRQILQGQESERQRIAVNLHDSLGQDLLVIKNQAWLAMQATADEADRQKRLTKISEITSQAIEEVRQITHDLRPYQLDRLGLTQAIRAVVNQASENSAILIATYLDPIDGIFDKGSEIHVYRIVQEGMNNILKHSAATEATVVIKSLADQVSLSIRDNGRGFEADQTGSSSVRDIGYGLSGMRERTRILSGRLTVDSRPAQGTSVTIEIPKPVSKPISKLISKA